MTKTTIHKKKKDKKKIDKTRNIRQERFRQKCVTITLKDDMANRFRKLAEEHGLNHRAMVEKLVLEYTPPENESAKAYTLLLEMLNTKPKRVAIDLLGRHESEQARTSYKTRLKALCPDWGVEESEISNKVHVHYRSVCKQIELIVSSRQPLLNL